MTPAEIEHIRRAFAAITLSRSGKLQLSDESLVRAIETATEAAATAGKCLEDALATWDPDPRIGVLEEPESMSQAALDLDELERARFLLIARRMERLLRENRDSDLAMIPTLWATAHDQAILEVNTARAKALLNGKAEWDDRTWERKPSAKQHR